MTLTRLGRSLRLTAKLKAFFCSPKLSGNLLLGSSGRLRKGRRRLKMLKTIAILLLRLLTAVNQGLSLTEDDDDEKIELESGAEGAASTSLDAVAAFGAAPMISWKRFDGYRSTVDISNVRGR
jgi:hypothetical protein